MVYIIKKYLGYLWILFLKCVDSKDAIKVRHYYEKKYDVSIGKYTYGYKIDNIGKGTVIGNFCSIAPGAKIGLMNHPMQYVSTHPFLYYASRGFIKKNKEIEIECGCEIADDVWIGANAIIMPGVKIGKGAIVGAGAVVTKNVNAWEIVGGCLLGI